MHFETAAIHAHQEPEAVTGAVNVPVFLTSTYAQQSPGVHTGFEYSRTHNPTRFALEGCLATLEGGVRGFAFASGLAATTTLLALFDAGTHVIAGDDIYGGSNRLFQRVSARQGYEFSFADMTSIENLEAVRRQTTKLVFCETPTNPMLKVFDLRAICEWAHQYGIWVVCDNTFATPYLQRPLEFGCDFVLHSTSKYIGGHSDVIGGAIVTRNQELGDKLAFLQNAMGAVPDPMNSFLTLRGLKTLAVRMDRHCANAQRIAEFLGGHPAVANVIYPGLPSHPQYNLARRQMKAPGGMISMHLKGGLTEARAFLENVGVFLLAESLGGVESLI
ncbi:MAG TPA: aminotransferase class V-fold PLP-dependent enzyme, partial [bacterium]|nr:aminotransferase class V-fold PLP-dependent enzyme [bacterium]